MTREQKNVIYKMIGLLLVGMLPYTKALRPDYAEIEAKYGADTAMVDIAVKLANGAAFEVTDEGL